MNVAKSADLENVKKYIEDNPSSINEKDDKGRNILHKLCKLGLNGKLFFNLVDIFTNNQTINEKCNYYNYTPLHYACKYNNYELVKYLIDRGAKVNIINDDKKSPLSVACETPNLSIIKELLYNGANTNIKDINGNIPLHVIIRYFSSSESNQNFKVIKEYIDLLLDENNINIQNLRKNSFLHIACNSKTRNSLYIAKYLIENGANINIKNKFGGTPLYFACRNNNIELIKELVNCGADITIVNKLNRTAFSYLKTVSMSDILKECSPMDIKEPSVDE